MNYRIGTWHGKPQYQCCLCRFETLDLDAMLDHLRKVHPGAEVPDSQPAAADAESAAPESTLAGEGSPALQEAEETESAGEGSPALQEAEETESAGEGSPALQEAEEAEPAGEGSPALQPEVEAEKPPWSPPGLFKRKKRAEEGDSDGE